MLCVNLAENGNDTADTNTDNNIMINKRRRGSYKKLQKLHISHEIERLLLDGYSSAYIRQKLGLSERSYNRYRQQTFLEQKEALLGLSLDFTMEELVGCCEKFKMLENICVEMARDSSVDGDTRINAIGTCGELVKQRLILLNQGPELITHLRGFPKSVERYMAIIARKNGLLLPQQQPQRPQLEQQQEEEKNLVEQ